MGGSRSQGEGERARGLRVSRRTVLGGMGAAGAGLALGPLDGLASAPGTRSGERGNAVSNPAANRSADVVVVGAGFAGLSAARVLKGKGLSALVLEARDRVGGRTRNQDLGPNGFPGKVIEMGGQFVGPLPNQAPVASIPGQEVKNPQDRVLKLAQDLGVGIFTAYNNGDYINFQAGQAVPYSSSTRIPPDLGAANAGLALGLLNQMAKQVPTDSPWTASNAALWDGMTVETWMRENLVPPNQNPDSPLYHLVTLALEAVMSIEPREISMLQLLFYIASAGNLDNLIDTAAGAQDSRFIGGSQEICKRVANDLGDSLVLNAPVRRIAQDGGGVAVSGDGFTATGKRVIVAIPPPLAGRIVYEPSLASIGGFLRDQMTQRFSMASILKVNVLYPRPFWRDSNLAGQVTSDSGAVRATFDNTPHPDDQSKNQAPGVILGFIEADEARFWQTQTKAQRYQQVIHDLANYFGPQALQPLGGLNGYYEALWNLEPFSGGGPVAHPAVGALLRYGTALRAPIGLIHWAGTETAVRWNGYMDGAVESGQRAAAEVATALGHAVGPNAAPGIAASLPNTPPGTGVPALASAAAGAAIGARALRRLKT